MAGGWQLMAGSLLPGAFGCWLSVCLFFCFRLFGFEFLVDLVFLKFRFEVLVGTVNSFGRRGPEVSLQVTVAKLTPIS